MIEFNINNYVYVQLTDVGRAALKEWHDDLYKFSNGFIGEYKPPEEDKDGWSKWQMWELMQKLGSKHGNGISVPFFTTIRLDITKDNQ